MCVYGGQRAGRAVVVLVIMRKEGGSPVSGLSEDRRLWREGEIGVVGPREQSNVGGRGGAPVKI